MTQNKVNIDTANPLKEVPQLWESSAFSKEYKRYGWDATLHVVSQPNKSVRMFVSDHTTLTDTLEITGYNIDTLQSRVRIIRWANANGMYVKHHGVVA
jgi:hypothetical protein